MKFCDIEIKKKLDVDYKSNPYVVKKYAKNWVASKKWTFKYLKNMKGSNILVNTVKGNAADTKGKIKSIKFKDYIEKITSKNTKSYLSTFYLFRYFPDLRNDLDYSYIKSKSLVCHLLSWIGPKGSITGFHCDWSENINIQIKGNKNFYLVSPKYNNKMYISDKFERISWTSKVDLKKIKKNNFPLFKKAKVIKVRLNEGDLIYIPRGWWHYVESLSPSIGISFHFWNWFYFFRDLLFETSLVLLHDIGLYKKNNCSCHSLDQFGKRLKRG